MKKLNLKLKLAIFFGLFSFNLFLLSSEVFACDCYCEKVCTSPPNDFCIEGGCWQEDEHLCLYNGELVPCCGPGATRVASCGGGSNGGTDRYVALGPIVKFVAYGDINSVPWPVTGTSLPSGAQWVENAASNKCKDASGNTVQSLVQSNIEMGMWVLRHGAGNLPGFEWADNDPDYPSCDNSHLSGQSLIRARVKRQKIGMTPTWYPSTLVISLPDDSPYRQFGIKILNGLDKNSQSVSNRPIYVSEYYTWEGKRACAWNRWGFNWEPNWNWDKTYQLLKHYYYKGSTVWHYACQKVATGWSCNHRYSSPISWDGIVDIERANPPYPTSDLDDVNAYYIPNKDEHYRDNLHYIKGYIFKGNRVWHHKCFKGAGDASTCQFMWTKTLSELWGYLGGGYPTDSINAFTSFYIPELDLLKSYVFKGDKVWHYKCNRTGSDSWSCSHAYYDLIKNMFAKIANSQNANYPTSDIDSVDSYYLPNEKKLKVYVFKGSNVWHYYCYRGDGDNWNCTHGYNVSLSTFFGWVPGASGYPIQGVDAAANFFIMDGYPTGICYPGYVGIGSIIGVGDGDRDDKGRQGVVMIHGYRSYIGTHSQNKDGQWEKECYENIGSCPPGYVGIPATDAVDYECPQGSYKLYTCKKIVNNNPILINSSWKPERGSDHIAMPGAWNQNINSPPYYAQYTRLSQRFEFTVDKSGRYYFVQCPQQGNPKCASSMTINGGGISNGNGWNDISYNAGTKYTGEFQCWQGECFYGLGAARKSDLGDLAASYTDKTIYVPLVSKIEYEIKGKVYQNNTSISCGGGSGLGGITVNISKQGGGYSCSTTTSNDGSYSTNRCSSRPTAGTYTVSITPNSSYSCYSCPTNCIYSNNVSLSTSNQIAQRDFTVFPLYYSWFQTKGGDVHAQGDIRSRIPPPATDKNFSIDLDSYPGLVSYRNSANFSPAGVVSSKGWLAQSSFSPNYDYSYFYQKLGSPTVSNFSCSTSCDFDNCSTLSSGTKVCYSSGDISINNDLNISGNTKIVVLIGRNLNINKKITVPVGSFLAFVVKGDINISGNVGDTSSSTTTPHLQGVYIADGIIDTYQPNPPGEGSGFRLVGAGLFYAKGGFRLERNIGDNCASGHICDATTPSEFFIFRPDLVINSPREIWTSEMTWTEVAP